MAKDEEHELKSSFNGQKSLLWKNTDEQESYDEFSEDMLIEDNSEYLSDFEDEELDDPLDDLTDEQVEVVNKWWDTFYSLVEPEDIEKHIIDFLSNQADLIPYLELHEEPLNKLAEKYLDVNQFDKYIDFIRQMKKSHPNEIIITGGEIELKILTWLLAKDHLEDIPEFLKPFQEYALDYVVELPNVVHLFLLMNKPEFILPILKNIYQEICESEDLIEPYSILHPIIANYIDENFGHPDPKEILNFLKNEIDVEINEDVLEPGFWEEYLDSIYRPFQKWPEAPPKDEIEAVIRARKICENYMRFLKERLGLHFPSAEFIAMNVDQYLLEVLHAKSPASKLFNFTPSKMRKYIEQAAGGAVWINFVSLMTILNGLYYFTDYLQECGNLTSKQVLKIKSDLEKIHLDYIEDGLESEIDTKLFEKFPIVY